MILLLGSSGYVGSAFRKLLDARSLSYRCVSRADLGGFEAERLTKIIRESHATFLINAAGYTGKPNVDACELHKTDCVLGNVVLPSAIRDACEPLGLPWGHVSSGCIYTGAKPNGEGFRENDPPNFCFRTNNCSFYSGCKALGEECLEQSTSTFVWRLRIPFDNIDSSRNYLSKLVRYERLLQATNSISQLQEFVSACLECWIRKVPFGLYNVTNTGSVTTKEVVEQIKKHRRIEKSFQFFESEKEFMELAAKTPRSNCVLDNSKLLSTGIKMSTVEEAISQALASWKA